MMNICESEIRTDIAYFEDKAKENSPAETMEHRNLHEHYTRFVDRRKQFLAAFLDDRPEAWQDYPS